nr:hypothetical protein Iba_chr02bCG11560 [Ipomoea batatas]
MYPYVGLFHEPEAEESSSDLQSRLSSQMDLNQTPRGGGDSPRGTRPDLPMVASFTSILYSNLSVTHAGHVSAADVHCSPNCTGGDAHKGGSGEGNPSFAKRLQVVISLLLNLASQFRPSWVQERGLKADVGRSHVY